MYLTQIRLDLDDPGARACLQNPYRLHQSLMAAFDHAPRESRRVLFRVEPKAEGSEVKVLVQSNHPPRWENTPLAIWCSESKEWSPALRRGQYLRFRLRANPTVKRDGKRHGLFREPDQLAWLARKLEAAGARLLGAEAVPEGNLTARKPKEGEVKGPLTFYAVRFEGRLQVLDPEKLAATLEQGIGSGKGLGFGLLSLARDG